MLYENEPLFEYTDSIRELSEEICRKLREMKACPDLEAAARNDAVESTLKMADVDDEGEALDALNAHAVYSEEVDTNDLQALNDAHGRMMKGLIPDAGSYRTGPIIIANSQQLYYVGVPTRIIEDSMEGLFEWVCASKIDPIVKSCLFHREFEYIHPYSDGNGRMGWLWQRKMLESWEPDFAKVPFEKTLLENENDYMRAMRKSCLSGDSTEFVQFMLEQIRDSIPG